jgi:ATP-dependent exoDNAse (exonuclease V) beta subunit
MALRDKINKINAGAGSGKTYTISKRISRHLEAGGSVNDLIVTTFTKKAARELRERIKKDLIAAGMIMEAQKVDNAWIGTVHSLGKRLIDVFTFEAGYAPAQQVIPEEDEDMLFSYALARCMTREDYRQFNSLAEDLKIINWQNDVLELIKKARENDISLAEPQTHIERSMEVFLNSFGNFIREKTLTKEADLIECGRGIAASLSEFEKPTQNTEKSIELAARIIAGGNDTDDLNELLRLLKGLKSTSKKPEVADPANLIYHEARGIAEGIKLYLQLAELPEDLEEKYRQYITMLFTAAGKVYSEYSKFKKEKGLVDYSDQENEFLHLLDMEPVKEFVSEQFKLLMVDEFQDTNPMQLAIFMKLATLTERTLLVGDRKQSIFSFRGTDPILIHNVFREAVLDENLSTSRRSRKPLVHLGNHIFTRVFGSMMEREEIRLSHWEDLPEDDLFAPAVQLWNIAEAKNADSRRKSLVSGILSMMAQQGPRFRKKDSGEIAASGYGDLAILCRSNAEVREWASELESFGIEVSAERTEYLRQAEVVFMLAAISYLVDKYNSLAIAELMAIGDREYAGDPGKIIDNRLEWLHGGNGRWMSGQEIIRRLDEFSKTSELLGVADIVRELIIILDLYGLTAGWRNSAVRRANIQQLIGLAVKYEERCISYSNAITLLGFLQWIKSKEELIQPGALSGKAVKVMTYHSAKGLEWPLVILDGLHHTGKVTWWGSYVRSTGGFNLEKPLENRELVFVHNPFGTGWNFNTGEEEYKEPCELIGNNIRASEFVIEKAGRELEEEKRLLYVGVTRARDYLILPTPGKSKEEGPGWWNRVTQETLPAFFSHRNDFMIDGDEEPVTVSFRDLAVIEELPEPPGTRERYYADPEGRVLYERQKISPSSLAKDEPAPDERGRVRDHARLGTERLCGGMDEKDLGDALHNILYIWNRTMAKPERLEAIKRLLAGFGLEKIKDEAVDRQAEAFYGWLEAEYPGCRIFRELPLRMVKGDQVYQGNADMLIETDEGLVLIDYKSYQGTDFHDHASKYCGQLDAYREMIEASHPGMKKVIAMLIYYPVSGIIIELTG